jgi:hypothetical protein
MLDYATDPTPKNLCLSNSLFGEKVRSKLEKYRIKQFKNCIKHKVAYYHEDQKYISVLHNHLKQLRKHSH